eukprot:365195-Chlamydomonas_euryale.AAC.16
MPANSFHAGTTFRLHHVVTVQFSQLHGQASCMGWPAAWVGQLPESVSCVNTRIEVTALRSLPPHAWVLSIALVVAVEQISGSRRVCLGGSPGRAKIQLLVGGTTAPGVVPPALVGTAAGGTNVAAASASDADIPPSCNSRSDAVPGTTKAAAASTSDVEAAPSCASRSAVAPPPHAPSLTPLLPRLLPSGIRALGCDAAGWSGAAGRPVPAAVSPATPFPPSPSPLSASSCCSSAASPAPCGRPPWHRRAARAARAPSRAAGAPWRTTRSSAAPTRRRAAPRGSGARARRRRRGQRPPAGRRRRTLPATARAARRHVPGRRRHGCSGGPLGAAPQSRPPRAALARRARRCVGALAAGWGALWAVWTAVGSAGSVDGSWGVRVVA